MRKTILLLATIAFVTLIFSSCEKKGKCDELFEQGCPTTSDYDPVCGCNGKTYANKSFADCAGVEYTRGSCDD